MTYTNGQIADSSLVTIERGARLLPGPGADWAWIANEVERRYGWRPRPTGPLDGYRPRSGNYYAQTETFLRRYTARTTGAGPFGDVRWWNGVRYVRVNGAAAAVPGTSNHGWGAAVDVADLLSFTSKRYQQFAAVAALRGWTNTEGRSIGEFWHWVAVATAQAVKNGTYTGGAAPAPVTPVAPPAPITPTHKEDEDPMDQIIAIWLRRTGKTPPPATAAEYIGAVATGETTWAAIDKQLQSTPDFAAFAALGSREARDVRINQNAPKGWVA